MFNTKLGNETLALPTTKEYQERVLCVLPFYHIYGWTCSMLANLSIGAKIITLPNFQPQTYLTALVGHKGSLLHLVPPIGTYSL